MAKNECGFSNPSPATIVTVMFPKTTADDKNMGLWDTGAYGSAAAVNMGQSLSNFLLPTLKKTKR
jgi:hypothetical protein